MTNEWIRQSNIIWPDSVWPPPVRMLPLNVCDVCVCALNSVYVYSQCASYIMYAMYRVGCRGWGLYGGREAPGRDVQSGSYTGRSKTTCNMRASPSVHMYTTMFVISYMYMYTIYMYIHVVEM